MARRPRNDLNPESSSMAPDPDYQSNLGLVLRMRYEAVGDLDDLRAALAVGREAVARTRPGSSSSHRARSNLGLTLGHYFERFGKTAHLDEAIEMSRTALLEQSIGASDYPLYQANLGGMLARRFSIAESPEDLDEAIEHTRGAVANYPERHPHLPMAMANLGSLYLSRHRLSDYPRDLEQAADLLRTSIDLAPADSPARALRLGNLARVRLQLAQRTEGRVAAQHFDAAVESHRQILQSPNVSARRRIESGATAGRLMAASNQAEAAATMRATALLLPQAATWRLDWGQRQNAIAGFAGIAADAAALLLEVGGPQEAGEAVRILETGRAVLLNQVLSTRTDLDRVREVAPQLAERFTEIGSLLNQTVNSRPHGVETRESIPHNVRHRLTQEYEQLISDIRRMEGLEDFLELPSLQLLQAEASAGPIVVLNASRFGCHAIVVRTDQVEAIRLDITHTGLSEQVRQCHATVGATPGTKDLKLVLRWMWERIVEPVLRHLGLDSLPAAPQRLWWVPGGQFGSLPLHAAGPYPEPASGPTPIALDYVISSITPSIRQLGHARRRAGANDSGKAIATVSMTQTPASKGENEQPSDLRFAKPEVDWIRDNGAASPSYALDDWQATFESVTGAMKECPIVHLACHAISDPDDPSASRLLLTDHNRRPLTVSDLTSLDLSQASLAYLSACETAQSLHTELQDESLHLTAAFQAAGYASVVGTLWSVNDRAAFEIAKRYYAHLGHGLDPNESAAALHDAVTNVRDRFQLDQRPEIWAAWIHSGA